MQCLPCIHEKILSQLQSGSVWLEVLMHVAKSCWACLGQCGFKALHQACCRSREFALLLRQRVSLCKLYLFSILSLNFFNGSIEFFFNGSIEFFMYRIQYNLRHECTRGRPDAAQASPGHGTTASASPCGRSLSGSWACRRHGRPGVRKPAGV